MKKEREETIKAVLAAMKAEEILEEVREYLQSAGDKVGKKELMDIIQGRNEADGWYS